MDSVDIPGVGELLQMVLGNAASTDFLKTCAVFALASTIHARKVTKEIKMQLGLLVEVLKQDLATQQKMLEVLHGRVAKIELHLQLGDHDGRNR